MRETRASFWRVFAKCLTHRFGAWRDLPLPCFDFDPLFALGRLCVADAAPVGRLKIACHFGAPAFAAPEATMDHQLMGSLESLRHFQCLARAHGVVHREYRDV